MEIVLARHGKPNVRHWAWITPRQMKEWIQIYNQAEIYAESIPSYALRRARIAGVIVSSSLPRCVQSARALNRASNMSKSILVEDAFVSEDEHEE